MKTRLFANQPSLLTRSLGVAIAALLVGHSAQAATFTYSRSATNTSGTADQWAAGTNWDAAPVSASTTTLTLSAGATVLTTGTTIFTNNDTVGNFQLNRLNQTYTGPASATTTPTITVSGGTLEFVTEGVTAPVLSVEPLGTVKPTLTISSIIAGTAGLTKDGSGIVTLSGTNTFSGGLSIIGGELRISGANETNAGNNLGAAAEAVSLSNGAMLRSSGDGTYAVGTGRTLTIGTGGGALAASGFSARTFSFAITGSQPLTLNAGTTHIRLSGDNSGFSGGFQIGSGCVELQTVASLPPTGSITINPNGGLVGSGANATLQAWLDSGRINNTSTGAILLTSPTNSQNVDLTGYGSLFLGMSGLLDLGVTNTVNYSGAITPAGTTYRLGFNIGNAQLLNLNQTNQLTGARNLIVGNGTALGYVQLSGSNDYNAGTTISNFGRLTVSNNGSLGSGAVSVTAGGGLNLRDGVTVGNLLTLNGGPSDLAFGALHGLAGANAYGGNIAVATGARIGASNTAGNSLTINGDIALGSNGLSFTTGSTAAYAGGDITVAGAITGTGNITKNNATGTLTLNNANPGWSGNTTVAGGALAVGNNSALGTGGTLTLSNSPTVRSSDATDRTIPRTFGTFTGTGAVYTFGATSGGTGNLAFTNTTTSSIGSSAARTFQVHNTTKFSMGFSGTGSSINKTGNGTMIMNGTSTYTGGTTVTAGTVGGNGTIGATSVLATGTIAPGDGGIGTLNTGAVTVAGTLAIEFNGANCDQLLSTGAVDLTGATLTVTPLGGFSGPYVIAQGTSVSGTMTVPPGYAVHIVGGNQAVLTQTGTPVSYSGWASANGVTGGVNGDSDNDGIPNGVEYGLNTNPAGSDGSPGSYVGNVLTFNKRTATSGNADLSYRIEVSSDLGISDPWTEVGAYVQNTGSIISATVPNGPTKNFARLQVVVNP